MPPWSWKTARKRGSPHPLPNGARTVAWANRARILQGRASNSQEVLMEQQAIHVGIDVAKAQMDVAVRPTNDRWGGSQ